MTVSTHQWKDLNIFGGKSQCRLLMCFNFSFFFSHTPSNSAPVSRCQQHPQQQLLDTGAPARVGVHGPVLCCAKGLFAFSLLASPCASAVSVRRELCASAAV